MLKLTNKGNGVVRQYESEDGRFIVCITTCAHDKKNRHDLMHAWKKRGYVNRFMPTHLSVSTYYHEENGNCTGSYNPTCKTGGAGYVLDFEWVLEATPENEMKLVEEADRMRRENVRK